ncbi:hypothetical protein [Catellatospora paridis]|uniref:hypothetical protein n=1 Tax=Catellatospora paridis TaxID=1617086 RepID=UPI0012D41D0C|nr:hypothetical protein [Catellatospora paridis]
MTQQLFDDVIGEVPAPAVDVDRIIRRERRGAAARRFGIASTGGLALLAAGALVLGTGVWPGGPSQPLAVPVVSEPAQTGAPGPADGFRLVFGTEEEAATTARRLGEVLNSAVVEVAPDRQWLFFPSKPGEPDQPDGLPFAVHFDGKIDGQGNEHTLFLGRSGILTDGRRGMLELTVVPAVGGDPGPPAETLRDEAESGEVFVYHKVTVKLADGRYLLLASHNRGPRGDVATAFQEQPPLSVAQLQSIASEVAEQVLA